jgi:hypothetical protein
MDLVSWQNYFHDATINKIVQLNSSKNHVWWQYQEISGSWMNVAKHRNGITTGPSIQIT